MTQRPTRDAFIRINEPANNEEVSSPFTVNGEVSPEDSPIQVCWKVHTAGAYDPANCVDVTAVGEAWTTQLTLDAGTYHIRAAIPGTATTHEITVVVE